MSRWDIFDVDPVFQVRPIGKIIGKILISRSRLLQPTPIFKTRIERIIITISIQNFQNFQKLLLIPVDADTGLVLGARYLSTFNKWFRPPYRWIPVSSRGRQRKPTARFAVTENRTRQLHARDIKDYNGRPLITGLEAWAVPREPLQYGSRAFVLENSSILHVRTELERREEEEEEVKEFIVRLSGEYSIPGDARSGFREQSFASIRRQLSPCHPQLSMAEFILHMHPPSTEVADTDSLFEYSYSKSSRCKFTPGFPSSFAFQWIANEVC